VAIRSPWREAAPSVAGPSVAAADSSEAESPSRAAALRSFVPDWVKAPVRELRFALRARSFLRTLDRLLISGGGQLSDDWGGPWEHPLSMLRWVLYARWAGTDVQVVSVGAGPFLRRPTALLLRLMLAMTSYRSYRDLRSRELVGHWDFTWPDRVVPDLAFSLPPVAAAAAGRRQPARIGLSPMSYCYPRTGAWPQLDRRRYERYRALLRELTERLLARGHQVVLLNSNLGSDSSVFEELCAELRSPGGELPSGLIAEPTRDLDHLLQQLSSVDLLITSRLHGVILAYVHGRPAIAMSYDPKIEAVMEPFGQSPYSLPIEQSSADAVDARLARLLDGFERERQRIEERADAHRELLEEQYDRLFGAVVADHG